MKRKKLDREAKQNLDPFLDIITNVIGLLVIFAALVGLSVGGLKESIAFPVLKDAPQESNFVSVCCFESRVAPWGHEQIYNDHMQPDAYARFGDTALWGDLATFWEAREYQDDFMVVDGIEYTNDAFLVRYVIRPEGLADDFQDICKDNSRFEQFLATKDPERDVIYFYVDGESFSSFRRARQLAKEHGFRTGWEPFSVSQICMPVFGEVFTRDRKVSE